MATVELRGLIQQVRYDLGLLELGGAVRGVVEGLGGMEQAAVLRMGVGGLLVGVQCALMVFPKPKGQCYIKTRTGEGGGA